MPDGYSQWRIDDRYPYNEGPGLHSFNLFPVSDLRLRAGIEPGVDGLTASARIEARSHIFEASLDGAQQKGTLSVTAMPDAVDPINESTTFDIPPLEPGRVTNVEFWHVDQMLQLWIDGEQVATLVYGDHNGNGWTPAERFRNATGRDLADVADEDRGRGNPLANPALYHRPEVSFTFSGGPFTLHRVAL